MVWQKLGRHLQKTGGIFDFKFGIFFILLVASFGGAGWIESRHFGFTTMRTSEKLDVKLRTCAVPKDSVCPTLLEIPRNTTVKAFKETQYYQRTDGHRATWRKIEYQKTVGWVNESLLQIANE